MEDSDEPVGGRGLRRYACSTMADQEGKPPNHDTLDAITSSRTLPSEPGNRNLGSAATLVAPPSTLSGPRMPRDGGEVLGNRYEVLEELGRGGEGVVYRVRDLKADTILALKLLPQESDETGDKLQRFRRELQMARKVTHPNVVRIHDLVELPTGFGLAMELVDGESLKKRIARGPLSADEVMRIALDLARALAAAHEAGVTHRDLKPENVLLRARDGHAMVADFGISRLHGDSTGAIPPSAVDVTSIALTREGALIGTPLYMAPEQLAGKTDIGPPTDVYAFGLVTYEAATGSPPHATESLGDLVRMRRGTPPPPLNTARPDLPRRLCDAVDRALCTEPGRRWANGAELLAALESTVSPPRRTWPVWTAGAAVVGLGCAAFVLTRPRPPVVAEPSVPPPPPPVAHVDLHTSNLRRLTFGESCEEFPSFTTDGQRVVYDATVGPDSFIYALDLTPSSTPVQLTHVRGWDIAPAVSPRGDRIAFLRILGDHSGAFVAPIDGSLPPRELAAGSIRPSWTRDGKAVWADGAAGLTAYDADTGAALRTLEGTAHLGAAQTMELGDGALLASTPASLESEDWTPRRVDLFPAAGGVKHLLDAPMQEVLTVTPDGRDAIVSRKLPTALELLEVPLDGSPPSSLASTGIMAIKGLAFSPDGKRVTWSNCAPTPKVVGADEHGRLARSVGGAMTGVEWIAAVPGTDQTVVVSDRTGSLEPWVTSPNDDTPPRPIAVGSLSPRQVAVSGDGTRIALAVPGDGLYVASMQGAPDVRRITDVGSDGAPVFERGDRRVIFARRSPEGPRVMAVPADGSGPAEALLDAGSDSPATSHARDAVVYLTGSDRYHLVPMVWEPASRTSRPLSSALTVGRYWDPTLSPDGQRVALIRREGELVEVDVATGSVRRTLTTRTNDELQAPAYTAAGLVVIRFPFQGNVWVADLTP
jgi:serine/threonine protein kinase